MIQRHKRTLIVLFIVTILTILLFSLYLGQWTPTTTTHSSTTTTSSPPCPSIYSQVVSSTPLSKEVTTSTTTTRQPLKPIPKPLLKFLQTPNTISTPILNAFEKRFPNINVRHVNSFLQKGFLQRNLSLIKQVKQSLTRSPSFKLESFASCSTDNYKLPLHGGLYKSCQFNNICLTSSGKWKLFMNSNNALKLVQQLTLENVKRKDIFVETGHPEKRRILNPQLFDSTKQHLVCHTAWDWLCFTPQIEPMIEFVEEEEKNSKGSSAAATTNSAATNTHSTTTSIMTFKDSGSTANIQFSRDFVWYTDSVVTMERVWVPINFGHGILEDLIPAFTMLQTLNMKADRPLFMTDERNLKQVGTFVHHQSALNKYGLETIEKWSAEWMAMLTLGKPLALCGGNSIQDHPCPAQKNTKDVDSQQQDSETIQACFSSLSFGYHSKMLYDGLTDREPYLYQFRDSIIENWNLKDLQYTPKYKRDQDIFLIGVQKKPKGSYNLDIIDNCEELAQYLTEHVSQIKERVGKEVQVMVVELEKMSMIEQILFFIYEIDMYITTQGAASYYSFFMKPGGYLIYAPSCSTETNSCTDDHISFQRPLAHLVITSMVRFDVEMLECLNRKPETNPKITHDPKLVVIGGCILKVNKEKLLQMVLTSL